MQIINCTHPIGRRKTYRDCSIMCAVCNSVIEQYGKKIEPPCYLGMDIGLPSTPVTKQIESRWESERGVWNGNAFINRKTTTTTRTLTMQIEQKDYPVLRFVGGPTGFEAYRIEDLLRDKDGPREDFCICGGTVNSWPACFVNWLEVLAFITEENQ